MVNQVVSLPQKQVEDFLTAKIRPVQSRDAAAETFAKNILITTCFSTSFDEMKPKAWKASGKSRPIKG